MSFIRDEKRRSRWGGSRDAQRVRRCVSDSLTSIICILKWCSAEEQEGGKSGQWIIAARPYTHAHNTHMYVNAHQ